MFHIKMIYPFTHGDETHRREQEQWMFHAQVVSDLQGQGWPWGSVRFVFDVHVLYIYIYDMYIYIYISKKKLV